MISLQEGLSFLRDLDSVAGFPLVVGGLALMLFGWRLWKVCVMLSYGLIGAVTAKFLFSSSDNQWFYALGSGAALGLLSYWPVNYTVPLLGGLIGAGIVTHSLASLGVSGTSVWAGGGAALIGCTAFTFLNRQRVMIVVTAFLGAVLVVSGLTIWVMAMPGVYGTLRSMAVGSVIMVPFLLLVPTVVSCFYQIAEMRRLDVEL